MATAKKPASARTVSTSPARPAQAAPAARAARTKPPARTESQAEAPPSVQVLKAARTSKPEKTDKAEHADKAERSAKTEKLQKVEKARKPKLVRDSFTIPKAEYQVLDALKQRSAGLARPVKKSELLRAGIKALARMSDAALLDALQAVPAIKTGRPKAGGDSAKAD